MPTLQEALQTRAFKLERLAALKLEIATLRAALWPNKDHRKHERAELATLKAQQDRAFNQMRLSTLDRREWDDLTRLAAREACNN